VSRVAGTSKVEQGREAEAAREQEGKGERTPLSAG
jgi:hypothetical protein